MTTKRYLSFDDILIQPAYSEIESRDDIDTSTQVLGLKLSVPIVSSPMNCVTGPQMVGAMWQNGGLGILHRFADIGIQQGWINEIKELNRIEYRYANLPFPTIISTGLKEKYVGLWEQVYAINIDTAHGHRKEVIDLVEYIKKLYPNQLVIAGNVATGDGFFDLAAAGADAIRVGIGSGSACSTRASTGVGVPQFAALEEIANTRARYRFENVGIISDGGIKNSGDMCKALIFADAVMLGKALATTEEASGETWGENPKYREFMGQSSFGSNAAKGAPEGIAGWVKVDTTVQDLLQSWQAYLRSAMSYVGVNNLEDFRKEAKWIEVSQSSLLESSTRV